jgi:hypothetical protein
MRRVIGHQRSVRETGNLYRRSLMLRRIPATLVLVGAVAIAATACSEQHPLAPLANPADATLAKALEGSYTLSFLKAGQEVSSLPVGFGSEVILRAHIDDSFGVAAQSGGVTFQYCSLKGLPPHDITRADEAPSSACADGSAMWANLLTTTVDGSGNAYMNFGIVQIPRTVGFRFKYTGRGSGIANAVSEPSDFTWVAAE